MACGQGRLYLCLYACLLPLILAAAAAAFPTCTLHYPYRTSFARLKAAHPIWVLPVCLQGSHALPPIIRYQLPSQPDVIVDVLDSDDVALMLEEHREEQQQQAGAGEQGQQQAGTGGRAGQHQ